MWGGRPVFGWTVDVATRQHEHRHVDRGPMPRDDVHWTDPASLRSLSYLTTRLEGLSVTVHSWAQVPER